MIFRTALFVLVLFGVGFVAHQGAQAPGEVQVVWQGYVIQTSAVFLVAVFGLCLLAVYAAAHMWMFVKTAPKTLERWREKRRTEEGLKTLTKSLLAYEEGDFKSAKQFALKTARLLPSASAGHVLSAKAYQRLNKPQHAQEAYQKLTAKEGESLAGLMGLYQLAQEKGDAAQAYAYATKARARAPKHAWAVEAVLTSATQTHQFEEALEAVPALHKYGSWIAEDVDMWEASLLLERATLCAAENKAEAIRLAKEALKALPSHLPALEWLADMYRQQGQHDKLQKLLATYWKETPRVDVFEAWVASVKTTTPDALLRRSLSFIRSHADTPVGAVCTAKAYMAVREWQKARESLLKALKAHPSRAIYQLLAEVEEIISPKSREAFEWLEKAVTASELSQADGHKEAYAHWRQTYIEGVASTPRVAAARPAPRALLAGKGNA